MISLEALGDFLGGRVPGLTHWAAFAPESSFVAHRRKAALSKTLTSAAP